jgi:hypothetical protein
MRSGTTAIGSEITFRLKGEIEVGANFDKWAMMTDDERFRFFDFAKAEIARLEAGGAIPDYFKGTREEMIASLKAERDEYKKYIEKDVLTKLQPQPGDEAWGGDVPMIVCLNRLQESASLQFTYANGSSLDVPISLATAEGLVKDLRLARER